jgi:hypothetical protein
VIQHFSKTDALQTFGEISRVLKPSGSCLIQMPNWLGIRSLLHLLKRKFAEGTGFEVRYWSIPDWIMALSERLRKLSIKVPWLINVADSVYISAVKQA